MDTNHPPEQVPPPPPATPAGDPVAASGSWTRPADYYAAPPPAPSEKKGCPRWLIFGCGGAGCLVIVLLVLAGAWAVRGGGAKLADVVFSRVENEADRLFEADVPQAERDRFKEQLGQLREYVADERLELTGLQGVLGEMNQVIRDGRLTRQEVEELNEMLQEVNDSVAAKPVSVRAHPPDRFEGLPAPA